MQESGFRVQGPEHRSIGVTRRGAPRWANAKMTNEKTFEGIAMARFVEFQSACWWAFFFVLAAPTAAAEVVGFVDAEADQRRAEYLEFDGYRRELLRHGIQADLCPAPLASAPLTEFHVIVYGGFHENSTINSIDDPGTRQRAIADREALEKYVSSGGGLIVLPCLRRYPGQAIDEYYNLVLEGFGVKVLPEAVWDEAHQFTAVGTLAFPAAPYFTTTHIEPHAVTRGVERLALPKTYDGPPAVAALAYDPEWTVLVAGEPTAKSYQRDADYRLDLAHPGSYASAPPIAAVREFGEGRVFCYPLPLAHVSLNYGNPRWPHTVETRGNAEAEQPSFSHQLVLGAMQWLAEPSQKLDGFGQRKIADRAPPVEWPASVHLHPLGQTTAGPIAVQRGIIGAHTSLSDGQGGVEDYARAADKAGLQFVVFAESLEHLNAEKWRSLVEQCRRHNEAGGTYLVPGYEYSDTNDCRWATWGAQVVYPHAEMFAADGKRVFRDGSLSIASNLPARMLLDYEKLPGDSANLWWYYNVPVWVYDEDRLVADHTREYLLARDRLFAVTAACFTRIKSPSGVAAAALRATWNVDPARHPKLSAAVDTSLAQWQSFTSTNQGGDAGPQVAWAELSIPGANDLFYRTRGGQRVRGTLRASAGAGLKEVRVHDGARGAVRRYLCGGAKEFSRTFELVQDRQHELVLEAVDDQGRRAISSGQRVFSYQQGFYRCGDNLNLLGSTPTVVHPDRQQFPSFALFEDTDIAAINGFDGVGFINAPNALPGVFAVHTAVGDQDVRYLPRTPYDCGQRVAQIPQRFPFSSYEINVMEASSDKYVKFLVDDPALGPFMPTEDDLPYATISRRVYLLRSRMDYPLKWAARRPHKAAARYQGDVFVHEGTIRFRRDATLRSDLPVLLERVIHTGGTETGQATEAVVADAQRGDLKLVYGPETEYRQSGTLRKGGWLAGQHTDAGILAIVPVRDGMRYQIDTYAKGPKNLQWAYLLGLGHDGQVVKKGDELTYQYLAVTLSGRTAKDAEFLPQLGPSFGLGGNRAAPLVVEVGELLDTEVFVTGRAHGQEFVAKFNADALMIDRPLRVEGVEDNGCVAVFDLTSGSGQRRFRSVGVFGGAALFQYDTDGGPTLWIGNPFYADDKQLRLTMVVDGLAQGERPFLEAHNPTDAVIETVVHSPPHTPGYGGFLRQLAVPAGDSARIELPTAGGGTGN